MDDTEKLISLRTVFTPNDFEILSQDNGIIRFSFHASRLFYQKQPGLKRSEGMLLNYADRQMLSSELRILLPIRDPAND